MEASDTVVIESLAPYRHLFPPARLVNETEKKGATVADTVKLLPKVIRLTAWQVELYVNQELRGLTRYEACKKLWHFVKTHIAYEKDEETKEQIRTPRRLIHDAKGDCDCMTTFIGACLYSLKIPFANRITKYKEDRFQHIYPVVPIENGKYIIMDCVVGKFNYEEPYTEKKDYNMDLQLLDGIEEAKQTSVGIDASDLFNGNDIGELGKLLKKNASQKKGGIFHKKTHEQKVVAQQKHQVNKKKALKVVNKVNKVNPVTALLRGGILASMKLNLMKVAERIKWGYASRELAQSKGMDMSKYEKVKQILQKTEKIFYAAGGKPENLKKSILTGHGNRNHEVSGYDGLDENTSLPEMLGEVYHDEFVNGLEGTEGLGEPATAAAITAASGAMGTLAALLASVGPLFPKKPKEKKEKKPRGKNKQSNPTGEATETAEPSSENSQQEAPNEETQTEESTETENSEEATENVPVISNEEAESSSTEVANTENENEEPTETTEATEATEGGTDGIMTKPLMGIKAFYEKNKKWIKPVGIAVATLGTLLIIGHLCSDDKPELKTEREKQEINGVENKKKKKYEEKKQSILALM